MKLVSMAMKAEKMKPVGEAPMDYEEPKYPYGLEIHLKDEQLLALGISELPKVGSEMLLTCKVKVTSARQEEKQDGDTESCCSLQIVEMGTNGPTKGMFSHPSRIKEED